MTRQRNSCPITRRSCRDCALYRAKHYFHCHPDVKWNSVFGGSQEKKETGKTDGEDLWYKAFFSAPPPSGLEVNEVASMASIIDWDYWPEGEFPGAPVKAAGGPTHFAIDVWCGTATLLLMEEPPDGGPGWTQRRTALDIPEGLLAEAVLECGGQLHFAGTYPINEKVKAMIRERVGASG